MKTLDRERPFSTVMGDSRATYYQDRTYFDNAGNELPAGAAGKPAENGPAEQAALEQRLAAQDMTDAELNSLVRADDPGLAARARSVQEARENRARRKAEPVKHPAPDEDQAVTRANYEELEIGRLNAMVIEAGGEKFRGAGAKRKAIDFLMENVAGISG